MFVPFIRGSEPYKLAKAYAEDNADMTVWYFTLYTAAWSSTKQGADINLERLHKSSKGQTDDKLSVANSCYRRLLEDIESFRFRPFLVVSLVSEFYRGSAPCSLQTLILLDDIMETFLQVRAMSYAMVEIRIRGDANVTTVYPNDKNSLLAQLEQRFWCVALNSKCCCGDSIAQSNRLGNLACPSIGWLSQVIRKCVVQERRQPADPDSGHANRRRRFAMR